jgi:hypothetical protein
MVIMVLLQCAEVLKVSFPREGGVGRRKETKV